MLHSCSTRYEGILSAFFSWFTLIRLVVGLLRSYSRSCTRSYDHTAIHTTIYFPILLFLLFIFPRIDTTSLLPASPSPSPLSSLSSLLSLTYYIIISCIDCCCSHTYIPNWLLLPSLPPIDKLLVTYAQRDKKRERVRVPFPQCSQKGGTIRGSFTAVFVPLNLTSGTPSC